MVLYLCMHGFPPYLYPQPVDWPFLAIALPLLVTAVIWTVILKGFALWHAARGGQKEWFIALLIINTFGILEIVYLIWFRLGSSHRRTSSAHHSSPTV